MHVAHAATVAMWGSLHSPIAPRFVTHRNVNTASFPPSWDEYFALACPWVASANYFKDSESVGGATPLSTIATRDFALKVIRDRARLVGVDSPRHVPSEGRVGDGCEHRPPPMAFSRCISLNVLRPESSRPTRVNTKEP